MKTRGLAVLATVIGVFASGVAYRIGRARADGAPTTNPLYFGGVLDDGGRPVEGTRSITVRLWDAASGGAAVCTTASPTTTVTAGRWRVTLDAACATAVQANPNLWAEVSVDGNAFPRSKVGAVPYALEAGRAAEASGALATRIAAVEARGSAGGARQVFVGGSPDADAGNVACSATFVVATSVPATTLTASSSGIYRVSTVVLFNTGARARFRIGSPSSVSFLTQTEMSSQFTGLGSGFSALYQGPVTALVRLDAGRAYTFNLEVQVGPCGSFVPVQVLAPIVVEQLN